eukprot:8366184-Alexandrium_andersonii.AAC.1
MAAWRKTSGGRLGVSRQGPRADLGAFASSAHATHTLTRQTREHRHHTYAQRTCAHPTHAIAHTRAHAHAHEHAHKH